MIVVLTTLFKELFMAGQSSFSTLPFCTIALSDNFSCFFAPWNRLFSVNLSLSIGI